MGRMLLQWCYKRNAKDGEFVMQYQGGKSRISKQIAEVIENEVSRWQKSYSEVNSCGYRERERVIATH